ncbi:hypothetical protein IWX91DRAFT_181205 [Phyllosticta citricarpa]
MVQSRIPFFLGACGWLAAGYCRGSECLFFLNPDLYSWLGVGSRPPPGWMDGLPESKGFNFFFFFPRMVRATVCCLSAWLCVDASVSSGFDVMTDGRGTSMNRPIGRMKVRHGIFHIFCLV